MRFAIIGTGFVADYYMRTMGNHPGLELTGVFDSDAARLSRFSSFHGVQAYDSQEALLADDTVEAVAVLTNPETHFALSSDALDAGKHVYCEKPLAMDLSDAKNLIAKASGSGLVLAGAPANAYSDAFNLVRQTLNANEIGEPKLIYAEMEDGAVFRENWQNWRSESGAPWPGKHEFEIGCTLEHAGYGLSWLIGLFGSINRVTGTSATLFLNKGADTRPDDMAPDFSTAVLEFENGVIARLTCGLCAPKDRSMTIMGTAGTLTVADLWDNRSEVRVEKSGQSPSTAFRAMRRFEAIRGKFMDLKPKPGRRLSYDGKPNRANLPKFPSQIDFAAGMNAMNDCLSGSGKTRQRLADEALHVTEAALVLNRISEFDGRYTMTTSL